MSRLMGKPTICICENKDADQLRCDREADQRLCFRYSDSTIPLLLKSEISSFWLFSVLVQLGLCRTLSETTLLVFPRGGSYVLPLYLPFCAGLRTLQQLIIYRTCSNWIQSRWQDSQCSLVCFHNSYLQLNSNKKCKALKICWK